MQPISSFFKEENDFLYKKGYAKAVEELAKKGWDKAVVTNAVVEFNLTDEQIVNLTELPLSFIKDIRKSLNQ